MNRATTRNAALTLLLLAASALTALPTLTAQQAQQPQQQPQQPAATAPAPGLYATLSTSMGTIRIRLYEKESPITVRNFTDLAQGKRPWQEAPSDEMILGEPFYDGLIFHRVIPDFMIQTGTAAPYGSRRSAVIADELKTGLKFNRAGLVAMANAGPNTTSSQFFITHKPVTHLNGKHAIFGEVIEGQQIVNRIGRVNRGQGDRPNFDITLFKVTIERVGPAPSLMVAPGLYAQLHTSMGTVTVLLGEKESPQTVAHFVALAQGQKRWKLVSKENEAADMAREDNWITGQPYFDGLIFHRVMKNFMSQSGGHQPDGMQRVSDVVPDEFTNGVKFDRPGRVGVAHGGPGTARAQFFITHMAVERLDGRYTVFGQVVDGIDVIWKMSKGNLLQNERGEDAIPDPPIILQRVTIQRVAPPAT